MANATKTPPTDDDSVGTFYDAIRTRDAARLLATLDDEFVGQISEGLPGGCGGIHRGPEAMMRDCWAPIAMAFDATPHPADRMETVDGRTVVTGVYRGTSPSSDEGFSATFVHIFSLRSGRIVHLLQVTDTRMWPSSKGHGEPVSGESESQERIRT